MNAPQKTPMMAGGNVLAIVPQSIEETWRLATIYVEAGLAPVSVTGREPYNASQEAFNRWAKKATSAVAIVIMAGAEIGQKPMAALRSWTVIGGKPALYGDGLINAVRSSGKAAQLDTGYLHEATPEALINLGVSKDKVATLKTAEDRSVGYCKAKRSDTGEEKVEIFSISMAKQAGLWDDKPIVKKRKFNSDAWEEKPNDSAWFRYPQRMLQWRAAGYCLRDLFADVLAGVRDEFEAREIAEREGYIEHSDQDAPRSASRQTLQPPSAPPEEEEHVEASAPVSPPSPPGFDANEFMKTLKVALSTGTTEDEIIEIWDENDVEATLTDDEDALQHAFDMRNELIAQTNAAA